MGCFLLNEFGDVMLEVASGLDFQKDWVLEIKENEQLAVLQSENGYFEVGFVHKELIAPLKKKRYIFVVERNDQFYATYHKLTKLVFT